MSRIKENFRGVGGGGWVDIDGHGSLIIMISTTSHHIVMDLLMQTRRLVQFYNMSSICIIVLLHSWVSCILNTTINPI